MGLGFRASAFPDIVQQRKLTGRRCDQMGQPAFQASNAIIYLTYGAFLYVVKNICQLCIIADEVLG